MRRLCVLGIDPGSQVTGYGVVLREGGALAHVAHGNIRLPAGMPLPARLRRLYEALSEIAARHEPDLAAVEEVYVAASPRSALVLGQARGAALAALGCAGLPVREYAPSQIKRAVTGDGRSPKRAVQRMVTRLLALRCVPAVDAADALATAICCAQAGRLEAAGAAPRRRARSPRRPLRIAVRPAR